MTIRPLVLRAFVAGAWLFMATAAAATMPAGFDQRVEEAMRTRDVPGMAIAVVQGGQVIHARGYGVRRLGSPDAVDADTIFPTGSTGKAVTAAALAILVDDGKLGWDDKVADHLPDFRMYDPWVTREMTVRDLLFIPRTSRSRADIVHALRNIKPAPASAAATPTTTSCTSSPANWCPRSAGSRGRASCESASSRRWA